ncbi:MAG: redox-sensing transcriptional repressor Rex [Trueperaceae bacterium]|nr:MAG: redox-sensing transcriptional repressor Rex [Trueperaceae bacterium]
MSTIPTATISRLVTYLRILSQLEAQGIKKTSSDHLAEEAQVSAFQVRKDLAYFGRFGTRGAGYSVPTLRRELRRILGLTRAWNVVIVGMGRLGQAIANYPSFDQYDFLLKGVFDIDPSKIGQKILGLEVQHTDALPTVVREKGVDIGLITVPQSAAQDAADALVRAGVKGILNFAPTIINVSREVHVEPVDFLAGLKRLSFYIQNPQLKEELA